MDAGVNTMLTDQARGNGAAPPQKAARAYQKHGAYTKRRQVKERGNKPIDGRSSDAHWRSEMAMELGGWDKLPRWKREVLEQATRQRSIINRIDCWLLREGGEVINKRSRKLHAIARERDAMLATFLRLLSLLDAKAVTPEGNGKTLADILNGSGNA